MIIKSVKKMLPKFIFFKMTGCGHCVHFYETPDKDTSEWGKLISDRELQHKVSFEMIEWGREKSLTAPYDTIVRYGPFLWLQHPTDNANGFEFNKKGDPQVPRTADGIKKWINEKLSTNPFNGPSSSSLNGTQIKRPERTTRPIPTSQKSFPVANSSPQMQNNNSHMTIGERNQMLTSQIRGQQTPTSGNRMIPQNFQAPTQFQTPQLSQTQQVQASIQTPLQPQQTRNHAQYEQMSMRNRKTQKVQETRLAQVIQETHEVQTPQVSQVPIRSQQQNVKNHSIDNFNTNNVEFSNGNAVETNNMVNMSHDETSDIGNHRVTSDAKVPPKLHKPVLTIKQKTNEPSNIKMMSQKKYIRKALNVQQPTPNAGLYKTRQTKMRPTLQNTDQDIDAPKKFISRNTRKN